jgi:PAS domain S-box-containing protein
VWGLFREGLVNLAPLARSVIVETMTDAVFVLDAFGRIADLNPAAARLLDRSRKEALGVRLDEHVAGRPDDVVTGPTRSELTMSNSGGERSFDAQRQPLTDRSGRAAGQLVVLRDITDRIQVETSLRELLVERSRIAATLQASLVPGRLPRIPGTEVATRYQPAGDGREVGGDFFDIFPLASGRWGVVLGDVSGKGSEAAAVTALTRYTLRTLADATHPPSRTLHELNTRLLATTAEECHCTLVYAVARPASDGIDLSVSLAGHHPPLVLRRDGTVEAAGREGTLLGLLEDPEFHDSRLHLDSGDLICLFTDGLIEARSGNELFGTERVTALLRHLAARTSDTLATALVGAVKRFHGADLVDDLALLIMRAGALPAGGDADASEAEADQPMTSRIGASTPQS